MIEIMKSKDGKFVTIEISITKPFYFHKLITFKIMKKAFIIALLAILTGCENKPYEGLLVHKEYVQYHWSNETPKVVNEAAVIYVPHVPVVPRRHKPHFIPSEWKFYVANKHGVRTFNVDSLTYCKFKVGDRVVMN